MSETFMSSLREAIMPLHDEAEKMGPLHAITEKTITLDDYAKVLMRLYGFVLPAEESMGEQIESERVSLDYASRRRVSHLEKDIVFLGIPKNDLVEIPRCTTLPLLETLPKSLGCLYLFEGSRLGGLVLAKALREQFEFENHKGYAYFGSDGLNVPDLWKSFRNVVEDRVADGENGSEIITAAKACFRSLNHWLLRE